MDKNLQVIVGLLVRHGLTLAAGAAGLSAYLNSSALDAIAGGVTAAIVVLWSYQQKRKAGLV